MGQFGVGDNSLRYAIHGARHFCGVCMAEIKRYLAHYLYAESGGIVRHAQPGAG